MHFLKLNLLNFYSYFAEIYSQGSNQQYASIGSDDGLALNRRQAIIWTNDGLGWSQWVKEGCEPLHEPVLAKSYIH